MTRRSCRRGVRGFSLLEVVVALVLLGTTGVALFAWLNQSLDTSGRLQQRLEEARLLQMSQALIANINPASEAEGELQQFGVRQRWSAELIMPLETVQTFGAGGAGGVGGGWRVGLYRVRVQVDFLQSGRRLRYELLRVGKQQA